MEPPICPITEPTQIIITTELLKYTAVFVTVIVALVSVCFYGVYVWFKNDNASNMILNAELVFEFSTEFILMIKIQTTIIIDALKEGTITEQLNNIVTLIHADETKVDTLWFIYNFVTEQLVFVAHHIALVFSYTKIMDCLSAILL